MDDVLVDRWNLIVGQEDIVYHLGDFALSRQQEISEYLKRLNGKKILIKGNHDWESRSKLIQSGFSDVHKSLVVNTGLSTYYLIHNPKLFTKPENAEYMLYGHVHQNIPQDAPDWAYCVGVDTNGYRPIPEIGLPWYNERGE